LAAGTARGDLLVTRSVYTGDASLITPGVTVLGGGVTAVANGSYPNVFQNDTVDPSFGVTSPIFIDHITSNGHFAGSFAVPTTVTTSFSSKSELAINLSTNGQAVTFMGYLSGPRNIDVSNSNTPNHFDPTNLINNLSPNTFQRAVVQVDSGGNVLITPVNAYSGNNGRAAFLANGNYYMVGNAGNSASGALPQASWLALVPNTGVQMTTPGGSADTQVIGVQNGSPPPAGNSSSKGWQFGFALTGGQADKSGKDDNFRGLTIFNNTIYVSKGSGGNGVNTVYVVTPPGGGLPTAANAANTTITILPGFPTSGTSSTPFGLWFANANTLYVAQEGNGNIGNDGGGLQKWSLVNGTWVLEYTLTNGLVGVTYTLGNYPTVTTDGLRNIVGQVNGDGTVTIFGVSSTNSTSGDPGADPNMVVAITDLLSATSLPSGESFSVVEGPVYGQIYRGVAVVSPTFLVPEPSSLALLGLGGAALSAWRWRRRRAA
jgi:hypothetical protein